MKMLGRHRFYEDIFRRNRRRNVGPENHDNENSATPMDIPQDQIAMRRRKIAGSSENETNKKSTNHNHKRESPKPKATSNSGAPQNLNVEELEHNRHHNDQNKLNDKKYSHHHHNKASHRDNEKSKLSKSSPRISINDDVSWKKKKKNVEPINDDDNNDHGHHDHNKKYMKNKHRKKKGDRMCVKSSRMWDVKLAPSQKNQIVGYFAPKLTIGRRKTRRLSIEVMRPHRSRRSRSSQNNNSSMVYQPIQGLGGEDDDGSSGINNEYMLQLLSGTGKAHKRPADIECDLLPDEKAVVRLFRPEDKKRVVPPTNSSNNGGRGAVTETTLNTSSTRSRTVGGDDGSISTLGLHGAAEKPEKGVWIEESSFEMQDVEIVLRVKNMIVIRLGQGPENIQRLLFFGSSFESRSFFELVVNFQKNGMEEEPKGQELPAIEEVEE